MGGKTRNILLIHEDAGAASRLRAFLAEDPEQRFEFREAGLAALPSQPDLDAQPVDWVVLIQSSAEHPPSGWLSAWKGRHGVPPNPLVVVSLVDGNEREQERSALLLGAMEFIGSSELHARSLRRALERAADRFEAWARSPAQREEVHASMADGVADSGMSGNQAQDSPGKRPAGKDLRRSEEMYRTLFESIDEGFCILEMIFGADGRPVDYRFLEANGAFERQTGLVNPLGKTARELVPDLDESWFRLYGQVALTGEPIRFENPAPALGRWFNVFASRVGGPEGRLVALVFNDITQRKQVEEALRASEARAASEAAERVAILEQLAEGVIVTDPAGRIRFVNEAAKRIHGQASLGVTPDQYSQAYRLFTEDGRPYPTEELPLARAVLHGETTSEFRWRINRSDGSRVLAVGSARPVRGPDGTNLGAVLTLRDETARVAAEDAIRNSEQFTRRVLDNLYAFVGVMELDGTLIQANRAPLEAAGIGLEDVLGRKFWDTYWWSHSEEVRERIRRASERAARGESVRFDVTVRMAGDTRMTIDFQIAPLRDSEGRITYLIPSGVDITERQRVEAALLESGHRFQVLARATNDVVWDWNLLTDEIWWNESLNAAFGYPSDQTGRTGRWWLEHVHPQDRDRISGSIHRIIDTGGSSWQGEYRFACADGTYRMIFDRGFLMHDEGGKPVRMIGAMMDITDRKQAEFELHKFALLVEASNDFIGMADFGGNITFVNAGGSRLVGLEPGDYRGRSLRDFFMPEDADDTEGMLASARSEGSWQGEVRLRNFGNGRAVHVWCNVFLLRSPESGEPFAMATVFRDLTQVREKEEQLRQAQKMEAIGRLAGGVAHDFNNLLTAINGYSDMLLDSLAQDDPKYEFLLEIRKSGQRAASLTSQLLAYSRKQLLQPVMLNLNRVVKENAALLRRLIGEDIDLFLHLDPDILTVKADPNQIHQILLNLCLNSRDAMTGGGRISIRTRNVALESDKADPQVGLLPGSYVVLSVTDTGSGMPPDVRERIFEPFFTTKEVGKGTGLGLSSVYGIVQQSGGGISVESEPGRGTTFEVYLPGLQPEQKRSEESTLAEQARETRRQGSILLVEDEDAVRKFVRSLLEREGYAVLEAKDGAKAMELLRTPDVRPDLLVSDVIMPRMGGLQLADAVRQTRPEIRILLMSGYTAESLTQQEGFDKAYQFIQKPFSPRALAAKIGEILHPESSVGSA